MSRTLDNIRSMRDEVVRPLSENGDAVEAQRGRNKFKRSRKSKKIRASFREWLADVNEAVGDICGMDMDILDNAPWKNLYNKGMSPKEAAQGALEAAEDEDDGEEDFSYYEDALEKDKLEELYAGKAVYKKWTNKLNKFLKKRGTNLMVAKDAIGMSNVSLHSLFMSHATIEMAARMMMRAGGVAVEDEAPRKSLRRRSFVFQEEESGNRDVMEPLTSLMEELGVSEQRVPRKKPHEEVMEFMKELGVPDPVPVITPQPVSKMPLAPSSATLVAPVTSDPMASALAAVQAVVAEERAADESFMDSQKRKQEEDEDTRARMKEEEDGDEEVDEASVMGGDFGRWGPATSAAGSAGSGLASAISKATGVKYKFSSEGAPRSSDKGSDLWFEMEPSDSGKPIYFLGIKIKGDKENPTWDVMLRKGMGLGSATSVSSQRGVETSGLKGAIGKLKGALGKSKGGE